MSTVRPMTLAEHDQMLDNRWKCGRCGAWATHRIVGPGAYRLCDWHAEETRRNLQAAGLYDRRNDG